MAVAQNEFQNELKKWGKSKIDSGIFSERMVIVDSSKNIDQQFKGIDSEVISEPSNKKTNQFLDDNVINEIHQGFQKEFEKSLGKGFQLDMLINDTVIQLNPDNTYEIKQAEKRELNTINKLYLK